MTSANTSPQPLDERDLATVRQLYSEAQNWTRHYEQLIVNANVLIVSACLIFVGLAFGDKVTLTQALAMMAIPIGMAVIGMVLTQTLFKLYAACIERMIRFERLLGCFDASKFQSVDHQGPLLSVDLMALPVKAPTSVRFFIGMHGFLILAYFGIAGLKCL
ncbi:hypothetical protein [Paucibacter sp. Y2R2-4]|uniref:hypothetical protein n=1 Tax=Paucibacter sp. Y2R2-4 TaxID=2893553 RepID=UPI0021E48E6F|nr:hypothetical protein [Paucibacter sp. Y2R2-4]MCV2350247.1 hypothetical protein [Paucibacter sp. Y2R2-4]